MPDSVMWSLLVVGVTALVGSLVAGLFGSDLVLWLFPVWFGALAIFLALGYGVGWMLRLVLALAIAGAGVFTAALVLPDALIAVLGPAVFAVAVVVFSRREQRRDSLF